MIKPGNPTELTKKESGLNKVNPVMTHTYKLDINFAQDNFLLRELKSSLLLQDCAFLF